jgi:hypothetical protein
VLSTVDELLFIVWSRGARMLVDIHARRPVVLELPAPGAGWTLKLLLRKLPILRIAVRCRAMDSSGR